MWAARCAIISFLFSVQCWAQKDSSAFKPKGFIDLNAYYDSRNQVDANINILSVVGRHLSYFSFTNFNGHNTAYDSDSFYSEQNLIYQPAVDVPIKITLQGVVRSGIQNDVLRIGSRWDVSRSPWWSDFFRKINLTYFFTTYVAQVDGTNGMGWLPQIEHFFQLELFKSRVYIRGFMDHNLNWFDSATDKIVTEHQVGIKILNGFYAVAEYRYNDYLQEKHGVGLGLEYIINY